MHVDAFTDSPGTNQDRFVAAPVARGVLVVVCDGAGGTSGGARAALSVTREIGVRAEELGLYGLERQVKIMDAVLPCVESGGETTCVALWVTTHEIYGVSVGDSEAWWVGEHDVVELTGGQSRKPLLGSGAARVTSFRRLRAGGRVVVGTDGFFAYAPRERWIETARTSLDHGIARSLVDLARLPNGRLQDDATVAVVTR